MDFEDAVALKERILRENDPVTGAMKLGELFDTVDGFYDALHLKPGLSGLIIHNPGPDPTVMAERYARNTQGAAQSYVEGMQRPKRDPKQAALAARGKWAGRVQEAVANDSYAKGVSKADYQEAVAIAISDGGSAYVNGTQKRLAKVARVFQELAPLLAGVQQAIQAMPQDTDAQREQRLLQARKQMIEVGKRYRGAA